MKAITFDAEMIRAIRDGRKTIMRNLVRPQPRGKLEYICTGLGRGNWIYPQTDTAKYQKDSLEYIPPDKLTDEEREQEWVSPFNPDDVLYIQEPWAKVGTDVEPIWLDDGAGVPARGQIIYKADKWEMEEFAQWRSPSRMTYKEARLFLRVKEVHIERLQEVDGARAEQEGVLVITNAHIKQDKERYDSLGRRAYKRFWDNSLKSSESPLSRWVDNPWTWRTAFTRITKEEAERIATEETEK